MLVSPRVPMNAIFSLPRTGAFWSIVYIIMLAWYGPMEGYFSVVQPNLDRFGIVSCRVFYFGHDFIKRPREVPRGC